MMMVRFMLMLRQDVNDDATRRALFGKFDFGKEVLAMEEGFYLLVEKVNIHDSLLRNCARLGSFCVRVLPLSSLRCRC